MNYNDKIIAYSYSKGYALLVRTPENFDFNRKAKFQYISTLTVPESSELIPARYSSVTSNVIINISYLRVSIYRLRSRTIDQQNPTV